MQDTQQQNGLSQETEAQYPQLECFLAFLEPWLCLYLVSEAERRLLTRKRRYKIVFVFLICLTVTIDRRFCTHPVYELELSERKHYTTITIHTLSCDRVILGHFIQIFFAILQSKVINLFINIFRVSFLGKFLRLKSNLDNLSDRACKRGARANIVKMIMRSYILFVDISFKQTSL